MAISPSHEVVRINDHGRRLLSIRRPIPFGIDFCGDANVAKRHIAALSGTETEPEEVVIARRRSL